MELAGYSEEDIIDILLKYVDEPGFGERLGKGDDARDIIPRSQRIIFSIDGYSIESVKLPWRTYSDVGWSIVTSVVSDIVSKGGVPYALMVSIGLPREFSVNELIELYNGMSEACRFYNVRLYGGDTNLSRDPWISIAGIGFTSAAYPPKRDGVKVGDYIIVTGYYGASGVIAVDGIDKAKDIEWVKKYTKRPYADTRLPNILSNYSKVIHASMDVSDGLGYTLYTLAKSSQVLLDLETIPNYYTELNSYCRNNMECIVERIMNGGEEYGVVLAIDSAYINKIKKELETYQIPYRVVGKAIRNTTKKPYILLWGEPLEIKRWDQFRGWTTIG